MRSALIKAIIILPGTALVFVPALILWLSPALEQRFGEDYRLYKANVPRWIPRVPPWDLR